MPYNNVTGRNDVQALIPEHVARDVIDGSVAQSVVFSMGKRLQNMPQKTTRMPILNVLPAAYFVNGDTGLKQTTEMAWGNKFLEAEELAVIVPIPDAVMDDVDYDLWAEIKPRLIEAFGVKIDQAVLYGLDKPASWPDGIVVASGAAGQNVSLSTVVGAGGDLYDAILGENGMFAKVEEDGFSVNGSVASLNMKSKLRGLRDNQGLPIFSTNGMQGKQKYELDGTTVMFPENGAVDPSQSLLIGGDFRQLVYAFRQDITFKVITEGVITDGSGAIIYNLPQQDMTALRAVMRLGWQVPNPINRINPNASTRYPFAALTP